MPRSQEEILEDIDYYENCQIVSRDHESWLRNMIANIRRELRIAKPPKETNCVQSLTKETPKRNPHVIILAYRWSITKKVFLKNGDFSPMLNTKSKPKIMSTKEAMRRMREKFPSTIGNFNQIANVKEIDRIIKERQMVPRIVVGKRV